VFFFSSRRRHTRSKRDWSSDVCSSDLRAPQHRYTRQTCYRPGLLAYAEHLVDVMVSLAAAELLATRGEATAAVAAADMAIMSAQIGRASCRARAEWSEGGEERKRVG